MSKADRQSQREAPAVEPPTDGPALDDPDTAHALSALRTPLYGLPIAALAFGVPAVWLAVAGAGWIGIAALTIAALAFVIATVITLITSGFWIGPATRLLRESPWRPAKVAVYRPTKGFPRAKLLVTEPDGTAHALLAPAMPWATQQLLARTGRIWLVGPDERGWAAIRSTGLALPLGQAKVTDEDVARGYEIPVEQPHPLRTPVAAGDAVLSQVLATPRRRSRTELIAPAVLLVFAVIVTVDLFGRGIRADQVELAVFVIAVTLGVGALLGWRVRRVLHWARVDRMLAAGSWTSVAVELPEPTRIRRIETVTAQATLADGRTVPVTLPRASHALRANIAGTGRLWVAGVPQAGAESAAGLPGYPFVNVARFGD